MHLHLLRIALLGGLLLIATSEEATENSQPVLAFEVSPDYAKSHCVIHNTNSIVDDPTKVTLSLDVDGYTRICPSANPYCCPDPYFPLNTVGWHYISLALKGSTSSGSPIDIKTPVYPLYIRCAPRVLANEEEFKACSATKKNRQEADSECEQKFSLPHIIHPSNNSVVTPVGFDRKSVVVFEARLCKDNSGEPSVSATKLLLDGVEIEFSQQETFKNVEPSLPICRVGEGGKKKKIAGGEGDGEEEEEEEEEEQLQSILIEREVEEGDHRLELVCEAGGQVREMIAFRVGETPPKYSCRRQPNVDLANISFETAKKLFSIPPSLDGDGWDKGYEQIFEVALELAQSGEEVPGGTVEIGVRQGAGSAAIISAGLIGCRDDRTLLSSSSSSSSGVLNKAFGVADAGVDSIGISEQQKQDTLLMDEFFEASKLISSSSQIISSASKYLALERHDFDCGVTHRRHHFGIDPYGSIRYKYRERGTVERSGYTSRMRRQFLRDIHAWTEVIGADFTMFSMEASEFANRFSDGVPIYSNGGKEVVSQYALVFVDGQHVLDDVWNETIFFASRIPVGGYIIYDDAYENVNGTVHSRKYKGISYDHYDHSVVDDYLQEIGFEEIKTKSFFINHHPKRCYKRFREGEMAGRKGWGEGGWMRG